MGAGPSSSLIFNIVLGIVCLNMIAL